MRGRWSCPSSSSSRSRERRGEIPCGRRRHRATGEARAAGGVPTAAQQRPTGGRLRRARSSVRWKGAPAGVWPRSAARPGRGSMTTGEERLRSLLRAQMRAEVRIHRRSDGDLMLDTPFAFPDGDRFPIHLSESRSGGWILSDRGHTLMHISYEHDVDALYVGARAALRERIVRESGICESDGIFSLETPVDRIAEAIFRFGQALTKIYGLAMLSRERVASMYRENRA